MPVEKRSAKKDDSSNLNPEVKDAQAPLQFPKEIKFGPIAKAHMKWDANIYTINTTLCFISVFLMGYDPKYFLIWFLALDVYYIIGRIRIYC